MKPALYLETTIISYLTARPSRDVIAAARQTLTAEWWLLGKKQYEMFVSALVIQEIQSGDPAAARKRMDEIKGISVLALDDKTLELAQRLVQIDVIPKKYIEDAIHLAVCATHGIDYLLTWNCKHLANAILRRQIETAVENAGYQCPVICTPEEIMESE